MRPRSNASNVTYQYQDSPKTDVGQMANSLSSGNRIRLMNVYDSKLDIKLVKKKKVIREDQEISQDG